MWCLLALPCIFPFASYCINIQLTKKRHHLFGSVRSPSVLFWPRVQHGECLLALTSTCVENKHLARQCSINNTPSLCCPLVSAAAAFCYFAVLLSLSFVVPVCACGCVYSSFFVHKCVYRSVFVVPCLKYEYRDVNR